MNKGIVKFYNQHGEGVVFIDKKPFYVYGAILGEEIEFEIINELKTYGIGKLINVLKSSLNRVEHNIKNPELIGGYDLIHMNEEEQKKFKLNRVINDFKQIAKFELKNVEWFSGNKKIKYRNKITLHDGCFYQKNTTNIVSINKCLNLTPSINSIINKLNNIKLTNLDSVDIFEVDNGIGMNFIFNKDPNINEFKKLDILKNDVISINYTYKDRKSFVPIIKNNDLFLTLKNKQILLPNNFFMQATKESQDFMINKVCEEIKDYKNVYDLYCGIGTYSFPLSDYNKKITCFEGEDLMIDSIKKNINKLNIKNLFFEKKDLYNQPITDFKNVDALVINPPRNGAGNQCKFIKNIDKIIYVSCNPETFKKDLEILKNNNYIISKIILIDQFFYSNHVEIICILKNNSI